MTCDPRLLSYYRDGALSFEERYEVEDHLRECPACTNELRGLMRLAQVVRSLPMEPVSPTLRQDFQRLLTDREVKRRQPVYILGGIGRALAPAGVAAAVAVSALVIWRPGALDLQSHPAPVPYSAPAAANPPSLKPADAPAVVVPGNPVASLPKGLSAPGSSVQPVRDNGTGPVQGNRMVSTAPAPDPIARFYNGNQQVRQLLGEASPGSRTVTLLEQSFQGGLAIWRSDTREIYVLQRGDNSWSVHSDTWRPGDSIPVDAAPPPGALVPAAGFGTVWRSTPEIKNRLGWAVYEPRGSGGSIQTYERGLVVWTPHGLIYVLSNDGKWRTYPDATSL